MISIVKAKKENASLLADIGSASFIESHGHSASAADINTYLKENYTADAFIGELDKPKNEYHIVYYKGLPAGYSKIVFDTAHSNIQAKNVTKLERIYLLKEFYGLKIGAEFFKFNVELSQKNKQAGMWLFVWKENHRAVNFYIKAGFKIIGTHNFALSPTHSNPNHQMLLMY